MTQPGPLPDINEIRNIQLRPIKKEGGEHMELLTWHRRVMASAYNSHDGTPYLATWTEESNISIWELIEAGYGIPQWATHVVWYPV